MLNKKISVCLVLSSLFALTACGGGNSGNSSNGNTDTKDKGVVQDPVSNGTRYYSVNYEMDEDNKNYEFHKIYMQIFNQKFTNSYSNTALNEYLLTEQKLYLPTDIASKTIDIHSMTDWTLNIIGDVKEDWKLEKVDLSDKNMFDTVFPAYRTLGFDTQLMLKAAAFLNNEGTKKFPKGSSCYRLIESKANKDGFTFQTETTLGQSTALEQSFADFKYENIGYYGYLSLDEHNPFDFTYRADQGTWQNVQWVTIYDTHLGFAANGASAVQYQGKTYDAQYASSIKWTAANEVQHWQTFLNKLNQPNVDYPEKDQAIYGAKLRIAELKTACYVYNETAFKALDALNSLN